MNYLFWAVIGLLAIWLIHAFFKRFKLLSATNNTPDSNKLVILTDETFKKQIAEGVSLVDFWAAWCTPCKIQGPIVSQLAEEIGDKAKICKLDVQHNGKISKKLSIRNIPTIIIFKEGKIVKQFVGVKTKSILLKAIKQAID